MSVPVSKRNESHIEYLDQAKKVRKWIIEKRDHLPVNMKNSFGNSMCELQRQVMFELYKVNRIVPKTKEDYEKRRKHLNNALIYSKLIKKEFSQMVIIYKKDIPSYVNSYRYLEKIINIQMALITKLKKSDYNRYVSTGLSL